MQFLYWLLYDQRWHRCPSLRHFFTFHFNTCICTSIATVFSLFQQFWSHPHKRIAAAHTRVSMKTVDGYLNTLPSCQYSLRMRLLPERRAWASRRVPSRYRACICICLLVTDRDLCMVEPHDTVETAQSRFKPSTLTAAVAHSTVTAAQSMHDQCTTGHPLYVIFTLPTFLLPSPPVSMPLPCMMLSQAWQIKVSSQAYSTSIASSNRDPSDGNSARQMQMQMQGSGHRATMK